MTKKRWLVQMDDDRLYFCIRHASGRINTIGRFTGCEENAIYMVELMNEAHDAREAAKHEHKWQVAWNDDDECECGARKLWPSGEIKEPK